jgi:hypothetical protein
MFRVGRLRGVPETDGSAGRREQVDDRLQRVGQNRRGACQVIRGAFSDQHQNRDGQARAHGQALRPGCRADSRCRVRGFVVLAGLREHASETASAGG